MMVIAALLLALLVFYIEKKLYELYWKKGLSVRLLFQRKGVNVGEKCVLDEIITNEKAMTLPALEVKFATATSFLFEDVKNSSVTDHFYRKDLFSLQKYQKITRSLEFVATKRGYYTIREIDVLSRDYLFSKDYVQKYANETSLYVYPKKLDTRVLNPFFSKMMGEITTKKRVEEDLFAFRGLREYRPTDSMRRINWKNSAHVGKMLVNMYETTTTTEVCLIADGYVRLPFDEEAIKEEIISLTSSVAGNLINQGIAVNLATNFCDTITAEPICMHLSAGKNHTEMIDRALARANSELLSSSLTELLDVETKKGGANRCYLVIAADCSDEFINKLKQYQKRGIAVYAIIPYSNRNLRKVADHEMFRLRNMIFPWKAEV